MRWSFVPVYHVLLIGRIPLVRWHHTLGVIKGTLQLLPLQLVLKCPQLISTKIGIAEMK